MLRSLFCNRENESCFLHQHREGQGIRRLAVKTVLIFVGVLFSASALAQEQEAQDAAAELAEADEDEVEVQMAVAVAQAVPIQMGMDPRAQQMQSNLTVQKAFMHRVCKLTDEQKKKLATMDNDWLAKVSKQVPNGNVQPGGLLGVFFGVAQQPVRQAVSLSKVKNHVSTKLTELLTPEQKELFEAEHKRRLDFRHDATAEALVESIQRPLDLSDEQRAKIKEKLIPWVATKNLQMSQYFMGQDYYPQLPLHLLDALTDKQKKVYLGLQRYQFTADNFRDGNPPIVIEE